VQLEDATLNEMKCRNSDEETQKEKWKGDAGGSMCA
jgi:hypothetical protein